MARKLQNTRPSLESLEHRTLLSGGNNRGLLLPNGQPINEADHTRLVNRLNAAGLDPQNLSYREATSTVLPTVRDRRKFLTFPDGTRVSLTLYGAGTLKGTTINSDGSLDIKFDNTNAGTRLIGKVLGRGRGTSGRVQLRTLIDAEVSPLSTSGVGTNQIGIVNLPNFDLIEGGVVNVAAGVQILHLGVIGPDTLINARSLPLPTGTTLPVDQVAFPSATFLSNGEIAGTGGLTVPGAIGGSAGGGTSGFITRVGANGQIELIPVQTSGGQTLVPGATLLFDSIQGRPADPTIQPAQIFGFDPATAQLILFDTETGKDIQRIPVPGANTVAEQDVGLGLARVNGRQLVLLGIDSTVYAYDVLSLMPVGSFSTANGPFGSSPISGIGHTDSVTILVSYDAQIAQTIDVAKSLETGQMVALGSSFTPTREFTLSGGATGAAGLSNAALTGAGYFDTSTPNTQQFGVMSVRPSATSGSLSETNRTAVTSPSSLITRITDDPPFAFGSIGLFPALVTSVEPATSELDPRNVISTYDVTGYSRDETINLFWPNLLTGLSESVNRELEGEAVINMIGVMTRIHAREARGMTLNGIGYLNTIEIPRVRDSAIIGLPVGHVVIDQRDNVTIISSDSRPVGDQGGVTIVPDLRPVGPLFPPDLPPS